MAYIKKDGFTIKAKDENSFYFIGVTTEKSMIMKIFPLWMEELGFSQLKIFPYNLDIHDKHYNYRQAVAQIKYDQNCFGALVTTHKMDLFEAAKDMFEYLDSYAMLLEEISAVSKKNSRLEGYAKDPISSGASFDSFIEKGYFSEHNAHILIFGAGGSSIATILHLINNRKTPDQPKKIIVVNRSQSRLDHLKNLVQKLKVPVNIELICNHDPEVNDKIMGKLPPKSIVINATGMGKDTPGSPITDRGMFPLEGYAWEFNYRGELNFLHQAEKQVATRRIMVEDGWIYFIHGWIQVIFEALHLEITPKIFNRLKNIADNVRYKQ